MEKLGRTRQYDIWPACLRGLIQIHAQLNNMYLWTDGSEEMEIP